MKIIESIWIILTILIIIIILLTDPKSTSTGSSNNQLSLIFASTSGGQKAIRNATWVMVSIFYILSLLISYYS